MSDGFWKVLQVIAWVAVALSFYFSNNITTGDSIATLKERVAINETVIRNESAGYRVLQDELAHRQGEMVSRMERMETKIDNLSVRIDHLSEQKRR